MARFGYPGRECKSAVSTAKVKKKAETRTKNDILSGWKVPDIYDEYDIVTWAKKREQQESKPVIEKKSSQQQKWDAFASPIIKKCRSLDNVQIYIDNSLSIALKPIPSHLEKEPVKIKLKHSLSSSQFSTNKHPVIKETKEIAEETSDGHEGKDGKETDQAAKSTETTSTGGVDGKFDTHSDDPENSDKSENKAENSDKQEAAKNEELDDKNVVNNINGLLETTSDALSETTSTTEESGDKVVEKVAVPRFGYTNANISLSGLRSVNVPNRDSEEASSGGYNQRNSNDVVHLETVSPLEQYQQTGSRRTASTLRLNNRSSHVTNLTNIPLIPGYLSVGSKSRKERVLTSKSESSIHQDRDEDGNKRTGDQDTTMMTLASVGTRRKLGSAQDLSQSENLFKRPPHGATFDEQQPPHMNQKQVLLVLKNVNLRDGFEDYKSSHMSPRTLSSLTTANGTNGFKQLETLISKASAKTHSKLESIADSERPQNGSYFPLAELLPAVDSSIRNSMPARYVRSVDGLGVQRLDMDQTGKQSLVMADDRTFHVGEESSQNTALGRPTFRPPLNKTPLQRAKENTKKRLDSSTISQTTQQMSEISEKSKYLFSSTNKSSRPGSTDENLMIRQDKSSRLSRKQRSELMSDNGQKNQLQQVTKALNARLQNLARQRSGPTQEVYENFQV